MSLSTNQVSIMRMMIQNNPNFTYMTELAAMSDTDAVIAIVNFIALMLPQLQSQATNQQQTIANDQTILANIQSQIAILQAVSPTTGS